MTHFVDDCTIEKSNGRTTMLVARGKRKCTACYIVRRYPHIREIVTASDERSRYASESRKAAIAGGRAVDRHLALPAQRRIGRVHLRARLRLADGRRGAQPHRYHGHVADV